MRKKTKRVAAWPPYLKEEEKNTISVPTVTLPGSGSSMVKSAHM